MLALDEEMGEMLSDPLFGGQADVSPAQKIEEIGAAFALLGLHGEGRQIERNHWLYRAWDRLRRGSVNLSNFFSCFSPRSACAVFI